RLRGGLGGLSAARGTPLGLRRTGDLPAVRRLTAHRRLAGGVRRALPPARHRGTPTGPATLPSGTPPRLALRAAGASGTASGAGATAQVLDLLGGEPRPGAGRAR